MSSPTFHAYEYTLAEEASNLHRNVIFKSSTVPQAALSAKDAPDARATVAVAGPDLYRRQLSNAMSWPFPTTATGAAVACGIPIPTGTYPQAQQQNWRAARQLEPLAEIMQVKGDSECRNGIASVTGAADEFCNFEKLRPASEIIPDCGEEFGSGGMMLKGCAPATASYVTRLQPACQKSSKLGVNPFKLGIIAATDTHIGAPAAAQEQGYQGSHGNDRAIDRPPYRAPSRYPATSQPALPCATTRVA